MGGFKEGVNYDSKWGGYGGKTFFAFGGAGGVFTGAGVLNGQNGNVYGSGGGGGAFESLCIYPGCDGAGGGGGDGAHLILQRRIASLVPGSAISVTVGSGGKGGNGNLADCRGNIIAGRGGAGAPGFVLVEW